MNKNEPITFYLIDMKDNLIFIDQYPEKDIEPIPADLQRSLETGQKEFLASYPKEGRPFPMHVVCLVKNEKKVLKYIKAGLIKSYGALELS